MKKHFMRIALFTLLLCFVFLFFGCRIARQEERNPLDSETTSPSDGATQDGQQSDTEAPERSEEYLSLINRLREDYNLGTCKTLSGNVSVILFYMDDFESSWTAEEIDRFTKNEVEPGLAFVEQQAQKYGIELNLTVKKIYSALYYDDEVITSIKNTGFVTTNVLRQAALQISYPSGKRMVDAFRNRYETEEIVCFTIFNKDGTAYALNPKKDANIKIEEHCIIFARDLNATENGPAGSQASVVAHEMLHLFGAEDFYASSSRKSLAKIYYPRDIMLSTAYDIDKNTIDSATAFYIGWTDNVPNVLYRKEW